MSTWKVSVYGDCLPLSHLSHHRRLDSPAPKYNQSWCPDEHVGSIVYGDYPGLLMPYWLSAIIIQYHPTNHDVLQDWQRAQSRGTIMLCVYYYLLPRSIFFLQLSFVKEWKITCNKIIRNSKFNLQLGKIAVKVTKNCRVWPWPSTKFQLIKNKFGWTKKID